MTAKICLTQISQHIADALAADGQPFSARDITLLGLQEIELLGHNDQTDSDGKDLFVPVPVLFGIYSPWLKQIGHQVGKEPDTSQPADYWIGAGMPASESVRQGFHAIATDYLESMRGHMSEAKIDSLTDELGQAHQAGTTLAPFADHFYRTLVQ